MNALENILINGNRSPMVYVRTSLYDEFIQAFATDAEEVKLNAQGKPENWKMINGARVNLNSSLGEKIKAESKPKPENADEKAKPAETTKTDQQKTDEQKAKEEATSQRSKKVKDAYEKIKQGQDTVVIQELRKDLEELGGTSDVTFFKGDKKYGFEHIKARGREKDINGILEAVANGTIMNRDKIKTNKMVYVQKNGYEALLCLDYKGEVKTWLLTGYLIDKNIKPRKDGG